MQKISSKTSKDGKVIAKHGCAEHNTFPIRTGCAGEFGGVEQLVTHQRRGIKSMTDAMRDNYANMYAGSILTDFVTKKICPPPSKKPSMFASVGWRFSLALAVSFALFGFIVFLVRTIIG